MTRLRRFLAIHQNKLALVLIGLFVVMAIAAPWLAPPDDPDNPTMFRSLGQRVSAQPRPPGPEARLGTVAQIPRLPQFGFISGQTAAYQWDIYYTLIWGARSAFRFGLMVTLTTATVGILIGAVAGYVGGWVNSLVMRVTDAFLAFPVIAAVWVFDRLWFARIYNPWPDFYGIVYTPLEQAFIQLRIDPVVLALVIFSWMPYARLVNAAVLQIKQEDYVQAARAMGAPPRRILFRHILPNAMPPLVVLMARDVGGMVVWASAFIFIGIGGNVAWGIILVAARDYVIGIGGTPLTYWWTFVPVSLALIFFGMGWNLLGDGLNTYFNPRARRRFRV